MIVIAIDLFTSEDRFSRESQQRLSVFTILTTFGIAHARVTWLNSRGTGHPICDLSWIIATQLLDILSVCENFWGYADLRSHKNISIAGPASQLHVSTVGTNVILPNYCQSSRTCKYFICQSTPSISNLGPRTCKFRGDCMLHALTVPSTHYVSNNCIYFQSYLLVGTSSIAIDIMTMKDWFFFSTSDTSNLPFLLVGCCDCRWLRNDFSIPCAPEHMSHRNIVTIYFHIWT